MRERQKREELHSLLTISIEFFFLPNYSCDTGYMNRLKSCQSKPIKYVYIYIYMRILSKMSKAMADEDTLEERTLQI